MSETTSRCSGVVPFTRRSGLSNSASCPGSSGRQVIEATISSTYSEKLPSATIAQEALSCEGQCTPTKSDPPKQSQSKRLRLKDNELVPAVLGVRFFGFACIGWLVFAPTDGGDAGGSDVVLLD